MTEALTAMDRVERLRAELMADEEDAFLAIEQRRQEYDEARQRHASIQQALRRMNVEPPDRQQQLPLMQAVTMQAVDTAKPITRKRNATQAAMLHLVAKRHVPEYPLTAAAYGAANKRNLHCLRRIMWSAANQGWVTRAEAREAGPSQWVYCLTTRGLAKWSSESAQT